MHYTVNFDNREKTLEERVSEVQSKIDQYKAAQMYQLEHGGPGPVADYEIMTIVNEYDSQFEVVIPPEPIIIPDEVVNE